MDYVEKRLRLLELYKSDYENKHKHLWDVFFRFMYVIVLILVVYLFDEDRIKNRCLKKLLFSGAEFITTVFSTMVLVREYYVVRVMNENFTKMCMELGLNRLPKKKNNEKMPLERIDFKTGWWMCLTLFLVGVICIGIILFSTDELLRAYEN